MTSTLPPIPRFVFTVFEPITLFGGWIAAAFDTENFIKSQIPSASSTWASGTWPPTRVLALQLGNLYGLLAMIGIGVLYSTTELKVVRNFLLACAIADIGHLYVTYAVMGWEDYVDLTNWNPLAWGNIGITAGLFVTRVLYLAGAFGEDRVVRTKKQAAGKTV